MRRILISLRMGIVILIVSLAACSHPSPEPVTSNVQSFYITIEMQIDVPDAYFDPTLRKNIDIYILIGNDVFGDRLRIVVVNRAEPGHTYVGQRVRLEGLVHELGNTLELERVVLKKLQDVVSQLSISLHDTSPGEELTDTSPLVYIFTSQKYIWM